MSFADAEDIPQATVLEADICIVGAGAAGLALAVDLSESGLRVLVLESGGLTFEPAAHALGDFENIGAPLRAAQPVRQRRFGGSISTWHGRLALLDHIDFEARDWVAHSGWPVPAAAVYAQLPRAARFFGMDAESFRVDGWRDHPTVRRLAGDGLAPAIHLWPARIATATQHLPQLRTAKQVRIILHALATRLTTEDGSRIRSIEVRSLGGNQFRARARAYVLACGGLENPRLLLLSRDANGCTVGNRHDTVGRFYMNHPRGENLARVYLSGSNGNGFRRTLSEHRDRNSGQTVQFSVRPDADLQRRERLLNACSFFYPKSLLQRWRSGARRLQKQLVVIDQVEQVPDRNSRVTLGSRRDTFGDPQLYLDWRIGDETTRSLRRLHQLLEQRLAAAGIGTLESDLLVDGQHTPPYTDASHPMGTTRMSHDPRTGVVDADCRVHGVSNLFVAGSSIFPTGGQAPPTMTIVCLALRLGDRLRTVLGG